MKIQKKSEKVNLWREFSSQNFVKKIYIRRESIYRVNQKNVTTFLNFDLENIFFGSPGMEGSIYGGSTVHGFWNPLGTLSRSQ
jgi:hypothetical protein